MATGHGDGYTTGCLLGYIYFKEHYKLIGIDGIKNGTEVTLNLSSNLIGNSNDETNFPHKLLLTNTQV